MSEVTAKGKATATLSVTPKTRVSVILDRSGSMQTMQDEVIGGFNALVQEQGKQEGVLTWSMVQFDHTGQVNLERTFTDTPTDQVPELTKLNFQPRGSTPLLDAVGTELARLGETSGPTIVVIITDGYENASSEYDLDRIKEMITQREALGWQFIFLGANQDAFDSRNSMGMVRGQSVTYDADTVSMAYLSVSDTMSGYRTSGQSSEGHKDVTKK